MKKIKWWLEMGTHTINGELICDDNLTEDELEEEAKQEVFDKIDWGFEKIEETSKKVIGSILLS